MAQRPIRLTIKQTSVVGRIPSGTTGNESNLIKQGELAINTADQKLFSYNGSDIFEIGSKTYLKLSGGTVGFLDVTGETNSNTFSASTISGNTYYSGSTNLEDIFASINITPPYSGNQFTAAISPVSGSNISSGNYSVVSGGKLNISSGNYAHAEGLQTTDYGNYSHSEGLQTTASGTYSRSGGKGSKATGDYAIAEGRHTTASSIFTHAEGFYCIASGPYAHAEGRLTTAVGNAAHAEGFATKAIGFGSHTEGQGTTAIGTFSHSEGLNTAALGNRSHSEGFATVVSGDQSYAGGSNSTTAGDNSFVYSSGSTSNSRESGIIGGTGNTLTSAADRSVILGGGNIIGNEPDTVYGIYFTGQTFSATTFYSGSTDLSDLFAPIGGGGSSISGTNDFIPVFNSAGDNIEDSYIKATQDANWGTDNTAGARILEFDPLNTAAALGDEFLRFKLRNAISSQFLEAKLNDAAYVGVTLGETTSTHLTLSSENNPLFRVRASASDDIIDHNRTRGVSESFIIESANFSVRDEVAGLGTNSVFATQTNAATGFSKFVINPNDSAAPFEVKAYRKLANPGLAHYSITNTNGLNNNNAGLLISSTVERIDAGFTAHLVLANSNVSNTDGNTKDYSTDTTSQFNIPHLWLRDKIQESKFIRNGHFGYTSDDRFVVREGGANYKLVNAIGTVDLDSVTKDPTSSEDGYVIAYDNTSDKYVLQAPPSVSAENGLSISGGKVVLGGELTGNTTIDLWDSNDSVNRSLSIVRDNIPQNYFILNGDGSWSLGPASVPDKSSDVIVGNSVSSTASGAAVVIGANSSGAGLTPVAIGENATVNAGRGIAIGWSSSSDGGVAIGNTVSATNGGSVFANGSSTGGVVIGGGSASAGLAMVGATMNGTGIAIGSSTVNSGSLRSVLIGDGNSIAASQVDSIGIGGLISITGPNCIVLGRTAAGKANGHISIGFGSGDSSGGIGTLAISIGSNSNSSAHSIGASSMAIGVGAESQNTACISLGASAGATSGSVGVDATSIGNGVNSNTEAIGAQSVTIGKWVASTSTGSMLLGRGTNATTGRLVNSTSDSFGLGWAETTPSVLFAKSSDNYINNDVAFVLNGSSATNSSTSLDMQSTTRAPIFPRMTTTQRDSLTAVNGMMIYNTTSNKFNLYENGGWILLDGTPA